MEGKDAEDWPFIREAPDVRSPCPSSPGDPGLLESPKELPSPSVSPASPASSQGLLRGLVNGTEGLTQSISRNSNGGAPECSTSGPPEQQEEDDMQLSLSGVEEGESPSFEAPEGLRSSNQPPSPSHIVSGADESVAPSGVSTAPYVSPLPSEIIFVLDDLRVSLPRSLLATDRLKDSFLARLVAANELGCPQAGQVAIGPRRGPCGALLLEPREAEGFASLIAHLKGEQPLHISGPALVLQALVNLLADSRYWCIHPGPIYLPLFFFCAEVWVDELKGLYPVHPRERGALGPIPWTERQTSCLLRLQQLPSAPEPLRAYLETAHEDTEGSEGTACNNASSSSRVGPCFTDGGPSSPQDQRRHPAAAAAAPTATAAAAAGVSPHKGDFISWQEQLRIWQEQGPHGGSPASDLYPTALLQGAQAGAAVFASAAAAVSARWLAAASSFTGFGAPSGAHGSPNEGSSPAPNHSGVCTPQPAAAEQNQHAEATLRVPQQQPQQEQQQQQETGSPRSSPCPLLHRPANLRAPSGSSPVPSGGPAAPLGAPKEVAAPVSVVQLGQEEAPSGGPQHQGGPVPAPLPRLEYYSSAPIHLAVDRQVGRLLLAVDGCRYPHIQYHSDVKDLIISKPIAFRVEELEWLLMLNASRYLEIQLSGTPWTSLQKEMRAHSLYRWESERSNADKDNYEETLDSQSLSVSLAGPSSPSGPTRRPPRETLSGQAGEGAGLAAAAAAAAAASATGAGANGGEGPSSSPAGGGAPGPARDISAADVAAAAAAAAAALGRKAENQRQLQQQETRVPPHRILRCRLCCCSNFRGSHMICIHPYGHVIVPSWPITTAVSRSSAFQSPIVAISSGLFTRAVKEVQFYTWGLFAVFSDAPISRVFTSAGIPHGFSLVLGKAMIFGQTPRDILEKRVVIYIRDQQRPFMAPRKPPDLLHIHHVMKVCPFISPQELYEFKQQHNITSDQVPMREYHRMLRLAVSLWGSLVSVVSDGDFTLGLTRDCCFDPTPLVYTPEITSPIEEIISSGFPNPKDGLFSSQLIGFFDVKTGE